LQKINEIVNQNFVIFGRDALLIIRAELFLLMLVRITLELAFDVVD
jgi:hypothetical protein